MQLPITNQSLAIAGRGGRIFGASADGTNDYAKLSSDLTGNADGKKGIIAFRGRFNGGDGVQQYIRTADNASKFWLHKNASNILSVVGRNPTSTTRLFLPNAAPITVSTGYFNCIISWDIGSAYGEVYIDDADDTGGSVISDDATGIDYTQTSHAMFARASDGALKANMDMTFYYENLSESLALSVEANRRIFFDSQGNPALNPNGNGSHASIATDPIIYNAGDVDQWHVNKGTGGGFTEIGAFTRPIS